MPKMSPERWMILCLISIAILTPPFLIKYASARARMNRAVRAGDTAKVERMLADRPDLLDSRDDRQKATPLQWAVVENQPAVFEILLTHGADPNAADRYNTTPLHSAAAFNRAAMARRLIESGADMEAMGVNYGAIRMTPLHKAAEAGAYDVVEIMLEAGADPNIVTEGSNEATPLHIAAARGHQGVIRLLAERGAKINAHDITGATPLHWAVKMEQLDAAALLRLYGGRE